MEFWFGFSLILTVYPVLDGYSISENSSKSKYESESKSKSQSESSSHHSKKGGYSYKTVRHSPSSGYSSDLDYLPLRYRLKYASDFDIYDPDLDLDFLGVTSHLDDTDFDLDYDLSDVDLDLDLLKLKYGFYGLNYYSLHEPRFNDYKFRRRLRYRRRPYYRLPHKYIPSYLKHDLDFWGLDNYSLGFGYDSYSYGYDIDTPSSYVHVRRY